MLVVISASTRSVVQEAIFVILLTTHWSGTFLVRRKILDFQNAGYGFLLVLCYAHVWAVIILKGVYKCAIVLKIPLCNSRAWKHILQSIKPVVNFELISFGISLVQSSIHGFHCMRIIAYVRVVPSIAVRVPLVMSKNPAPVIGPRLFISASRAKYSCNTNSNNK